MRVLVIVPAHNEEKNLPFLIPEIQRLGWASLIINDCSTDGTADLLDKMGWLHLDLTVNAGLAKVTQMGFRYAAEHDYDAAVVVDGDGQHPPKYIASLLQEVENGYDYVVGSRYVSEKKPVSMRMIGSRWLCHLIRLKTGTRVTDPTSGMRAMGRKVICEFADNMNYIAEPDALVHLIRKHYRFKEVQVHMEERTEGVSYFMSPWRSAHYMWDTIISILFLQ